MKGIQKHLKRIIAQLFTITMITACGQTTKKDLIIGKWQFEKFTTEMEGMKVSKEEAQMLYKANNENKGLTITFTSDKTFQSEQKGGLKANNSKGKYSIIEKDLLILMGDTCRILQLDKAYLKLHSTGRPIVTFKRM